MDAIMDPGSEAYADLVTRVGPAAAEAAVRQAAGDMALLARLRASGRVLRRGPETAFVRRVEDMAFPNRTRGLDTIRPNPKSKKKGKRR